MLCTFSTEETRIDSYNTIKKHTENNIYSYYNKDNSDEVFLIYNYIDIKIPKTIVIQRKTPYNIYFTINSLNRLIEINNNYVIDWNEFPNNLLILTNEEQLKKIFLKKH